MKKIASKLVLFMTALLISCGNDSSSFSEFFSSENGKKSFILSQLNRAKTTPARGSTTVNLLLIDSATGEFINQSARIEVSGSRADAFTDGSGNSYQNYYTTNGQLKLSMARGNRPPTSRSPVKLEFTVHSNDYLIGSGSLEIDRISSNTLQINMVNPNNTPAGVFGIQDMSGRIANDRLLSDLEIDTPFDPETGSSATFSLPAGTIVTDANGEPLQGQLTSTVVFFNNQNSTSLLSFPGGFNAELAVDESGNPGQVLFISAGFAAIEIQDSAGRIAKNFSQNAQLTILSPGSTVNPDTGLPITSGETVPIWSLDEEIGWSYEGEEQFSSNNDGTFTVTKELNHLSYWNLDWRSDTCPSSRKIDVNNNDGRMINYVLTRVGGGYARQFSAADNVLIFKYAPAGTPMRLEAYSDGLPVGALDIDDLCVGDELDLELTLPEAIEVPVAVRAECRNPQAGDFGQVDSNVNTMLSYKYQNCTAGGTVTCNWSTTELGEGSVTLKGLLEGGTYTLNTSYESPDTGELIPVSHQFVADGNSQDLVVEYCAGTNADLLDISLSQGVLSPVFEPSVYSYNTEISSSEFQVAAISRDPSATITIDGITVSSGEPVTITLAKNKNVSITVVSVDGNTVQNYSVSVRKSNIDSVLTSLELSTGNLNPIFQIDNLDYIAQIPFRTTAMTVTPTAFNEFAQILVNGSAVVSASASPSIPLNIGENIITIQVISPDGKYQRTYTITAIRDFIQQAYVKPSVVQPYALFGTLLDIDGDTMAVQAKDGVYIFIRSGATWSEQARLPLGYISSIALEGDTLVLGDQYDSSNATGINGDETNLDAPNSGAVYIFTRSGSSWSKTAYIKASNTDAYDNFGFSVSISGNTIVVGAPGEKSGAIGINGNQADNFFSNSGAAYIFTNSGGVWSQQAYVKASNTDINDRFGSSVSISGDIVVVGAPIESSNATGIGGAQNDNSALSSGAAYVFKRNISSWSQSAYLKADNAEALDQFGYSVSISGDSVIVGAPFESSNATGINGDGSNNNSPTSGAAYIFTTQNGAWSQQAYVKASNTNIIGSGFQRGDMFGFSVAIDGDIAVVGAPYEASSATGINGDGLDNSVPTTGAGYLFTRSISNWREEVYIKASNSQQTDQFGMCVASSGGTTAIGAPYEASGATGVNGDETDNSAASSGAAYLFQ